MTSACERFGFTHYSASSCSTYQSNLGLWIIERLMGFKSKVGCAAYRGTASERGVELGITTGAPLDECVAAALREYDVLSALSVDPNREKERDAIPGIVEQALEELLPYGPPSHCQHKIEWRHESLPLPFIGFIDFMWESHGIIVDLKTQLRLSSEITTKHARQVSLYAGAMGDNYDGRVAYVTPKKRAVYRVENMRQHVEGLVKIAQAMERFLSKGETAEELASLIVPDTDSFYFNDPATRQKAFEVFGI